MKLHLDLPTLRRSARIAEFAAVTSSMLAVFETHSLLAPAAQRDPLFARYRARYLDYVLRIFGVTLQVLPREPSLAVGPRLVISNHRSALDIAILVRQFGGNIVSRADLARWPLIGTVARTAGTIFVDRSEGGKRASAARAIRRRLIEGATVTVFPEGTTFGDDTVRPFHPGVFASAKGLDLEIVPVGLAYEPGAEYREKTFTAHLGKIAARERTRVVLCIGTPRRPEADTRATAELVHGDVQQLVTKARDALDGPVS